MDDELELDPKDMTVEQVHEKMMTCPPNEREYWEAEFFRQQESAEALDALLGYKKEER